MDLRYEMCILHINHFFYVYEQVLTITFDGAAANRRFLKLMGSEKVLFKVINKYSLEKRPLFFFSDPPHLLLKNHKKLFSVKGQASVGKHLLHMSKYGFALFMMMYLTFSAMEATYCFSISLICIIVIEKKAWDCCYCLRSN